MTVAESIDQSLTGRNAIGRPDRRSVIAEAALDILGAQGSRGLTHRAIDRHLGWSEGTTSSYFRRREDLVLAAIRALFDGDFDNFSTFFGRLLDDSEPIDVPKIASQYASLLRVTRANLSEARMLARYECFLLARRMPEADRLLHQSFSSRSAKVGEIFRRLGAKNPDLAATQFEIGIRGAYFTAAFAPQLLDPPGILDSAYFERELEAAMRA